MLLTDLKKSFLISATLHAALFLFLTSVKITPRIAEKRIEIAIVTPQENQNKELLGALQALEKKLKVVEQDKINSDVDQKAEYLSTHNQKIIKQTVAAHHGQFNNSLSKSQGQKNDINRMREVPNAPKELDLFGAKTVKDRFKIFEEGKDKTGLGGQQAQSLESLKGVDPGLQTLLSTREFLFSSYYNRIRNQLSQHWEPLIKDKFLQLYRQGREPASAQDRITKVIITLDSNGILRKVRIMSESGIKDLDDAAIEAFRAAAPFPNPPKGIIGEDGMIQINWDFIIEA